ncbi:MAG: ArsA family ATPase, partial [Thermoactinospora sp.]|nr:ArsA family ATPase [Thermoactinospora sp.]
DEVIDNRVFPAGGADEWRANWVAAQSRLLAEAEESFAPLPIHTIPYLPAEPVGRHALAEVGAALYGDSDPFAAHAVAPPLRLSTDELTLALPGADRDDIDLARKGDELIITAGPYRRILALPAALARRKIAGAALRDGFLKVRFSSGSESAAE